MIIFLKRTFSYFSINAFVFLILILVIQNSSYKSKVNFYFNNTVDLPISFIMSASFISGSFFGSLFTISNSTKRQI